VTREAIAAIPLNELLAKYPIHGRVQGWLFRQRETSNGAWLVEGSDRWGRLVSCTGGDPEEILAKLIIEAEEINRQVANAP
jgi:hypothetical protein